MKQPPNIVLVQSDDHARWALPEYGGDQFHTPTISALAARGIVMDQAFTPTPVCSPARASTMTGLMPSQHGIRDFLSSQPAFRAVDWMAGLDTLAQVLTRAGYFCGLSGKWHLGRDATPAPGFAEWRAMSGDYPILHQGNHAFSVNGDVRDEPGVLTDNITRHAIDILDGRPGNTPVFLYVGYYATHSPWSGHPSQLVPDDEALVAIEPTPNGYEALNVELQDATPESQRDARAQYRAAVAQIDDGLRQILAAIPEDEDTIVVYTADHGLSLGQRGLFGKGNATYPQNLFDEHIRIPMILSRPGTWPEGIRSDAIADLTDLYKTLTCAAGVAGAETDGLARPGTDLLPVIRAETTGKPFQVCEYGPLSLLHDGTTGQLRPAEDIRPGDPVSEKLGDFYRSLNCAPPWAWQPPAEYVFNPTDAWRPPRKT